MTIYKIVNKSNGKVYIGSTLKDFNIRLCDHKKRSGGNRGLCEWFSDINPDDLSGEILEVIKNPSDEEVRFRTRESYYCLLYRELGYELYNKRIDALHHSDNTKHKISKSLKGRSCSESAKKVLLEYNKNNMFGNSHAHHHVIEYKGDIYNSSVRLFNKLIEDGYELTYHQVNNLVSNGMFSKKNKEKYPELPNLLKVLE